MGFDPAGGVPLPIEPVVPGSFVMLVLPGGVFFIAPDEPAELDIDEFVDPDVEPTPATPPAPEDPELPPADWAHAPTLTVNAIALAAKNAFMITFLPVLRTILESSNGGKKLWFLLELKF